MAAKKVEEAKPESVPVWYITYADMVTLLLALFVILASMSKVQEERFSMVVDSIREYFGYEEGKAPEPGDAVSGSLYQQLRRVANESGGPQAAGAAVQNVFGQHLTVQTVEEGYKITIGGKVLFDEGSAELKVSAYPPLDRLAGIVKGYFNKIEIRGHTAIEQLTPGSPYKDLFDLAYARAKAVAEYLIAQNVDARRIRLQSGGPYDRPDSNLSYEGQAANRRVEVIVSDELILPEGAGG